MNNNKMNKWNYKQLIIIVELVQNVFPLIPKLKHFDKLSTNMLIFAYEN